ncbi:MAG: molybdopterin biosynthesis protein [Rhodobacterales bacterium 17-64-5]|nr:MAG: molybdopterin biosynthesis protein [Rhodobacterales bacterium 17-64-5]
MRWGAVAALWAAAVVVNLVLPEGHRLREMTGGDARVWVAVALGFGAVLGYRVLLKWLKKRVKLVASVAAAAAFSSAEVERYARHILLREIGGPGQRRLKDAKVLVVGAGGLGSAVLLYLAAAGVGEIGVIDDDTVDSSNLQRQIIHKDQGIGLPKVQSAMQAVNALNPYVEVRPYQRRFSAETVAVLEDYDLVLDGSDNFDTRYLVNALATRAAKPLISGAITQWEGQISLYDPAHGTPCYACVFPDRPAPGMVPSCAEAGVAAPLPGVIGAMMAMEAVKHITGAGMTLRGRLLIHDALYAETRVIEITRRPDCPVCGTTD